MRRLFFILLLAFTAVIPHNLYAQSEATDVTVMILELWPDYDRSELLVIHTMILPPTQALPASVSYDLPPNSTLHTIARFNENQQSLSDDVDYQQNGANLIITAPEAGVRVEYYVPYTTTADGQHKIDFAWPSNFNSDLLQISVQQPRFAENFNLSAAVLESQVQANGIRYYALPPREVAQGETVAVSFTYDLPDGLLTNPTQLLAEENNAAEFSIANNLLNNLPWVMGGVIMLIIAIVFLRQGVQERQQSRRKPRPNKICANCQQENKGQARFCRNCGEPLG